MCNGNDHNAVLRDRENHAKRKPFDRALPMPLIDPRESAGIYRDFNECSLDRDNKSCRRHGAPARIPSERLVEIAPSVREKVDG
jgi:hypothetical protein